MPGPAKKEQISDTVAKAMTGNSIPKAMGTKAGNKDWSSSSFYVPKKINLRFNNAINTLKAYGYDVDRSDLLSAFMDRFAEAVKVAEESTGDDEEINLTDVLKQATGVAAGDVGEVSKLKQQLSSTLKMAAKYADISEKDSGVQQQQIQEALALVPEDERQRLLDKWNGPEFLAEAVLGGSTAETEATTEQMNKFNALMAKLSAKLGGDS